MTPFEITVNLHDMTPNTMAEIANDLSSAIDSSATDQENTTHYDQDSMRGAYWSLVGFLRDSEGMEFITAYVHAPHWA